MKLFLIVIAFFLFNSLSLQSQYFQQEVNYKINISLNDQKHLLRGFIEFEYINNSPDTLKEFFVHLWPNAYQPGTALYRQLINLKNPIMYFGNSSDFGFMDSLNFQIDGQKVEFSKYQGNPDIAKVNLNQQILPGQKIKFTTPFRVKIPNGEISRLGRINQDYMITQWYPKPAVYDREGWHPMPYLTQGEFYSEFGSFDVSITLPENYVVGATGILQNDSEWAFIKQRIAESEAAIAAKEKLNFNSKTNKLKTIRFLQDNVHDFAWFASKEFYVLSRDFEVNGNTITAFSMFKPENTRLWTKSLDYLENSVKFYSEMVGTYPYRYVTAVDGTIAAGGGMEYPMITIIGNMGSAVSLDQVIAHEVGHNWFYGILASNERRYPFMDEGMNSFVEKKYMEKYYGDRPLVGNIKKFGLNKWKRTDLYYLGYKLVASRNLDQALNLHSEDYSDINYGAIVYFKSAVVWDMLRGYLGDDLFMKAMHSYYNEWKFKHPYPEDLRSSFENATNLDLGWFFDDVIGTTKKADYALKGVEVVVKDSMGFARVVNKGDLAIPFPISCYRDDTLYLGTTWIEGFKGEKTVEFSVFRPEKVVIDEKKQTLDIKLHNNVREVKQIPGWRGFKPMPLYSLPNNEFYPLYYTPLLSYNYNDGLVIGVGLYNTSVFGKTFDYYLLPGFGFRSGEFVGLGGMTFNFFPENPKVREIKFNIEGARYSYSDRPIPLMYQRLAPSLNIVLGPKRFTTHKKHTLNATARYIDKDAAPFFIDILSRDRMNYMVNSISYQYENKRMINPFNLKINLEHIDEFGLENTLNQRKSTPIFKLFVETNHTLTYLKENKGLDIRFFAGTFLTTPDNSVTDFRFRMSAWDGNWDYKFDEFYFTRGSTGGFLTQQSYIHDGGFRTFSGIGQSNRWLTALNFTASLPIPIVKLFADIGAYRKLSTVTGLFPILTKTIDFEYSMGVTLSFVKNIFEIHLPLYHSPNIRDNLALTTRNYFERIRFQLNVRELNPFHQIKKRLVK